MKNLNNKNKNSKTHHIVISEENYSKLKSLGKLGDTFDKVLGDILSTKNKNQIMVLESGRETLAAATDDVITNRVANNFLTSSSPPQ
jgi:predicted CopG family antitoxin